VRHDQAVVERQQRIVGRDRLRVGDVERCIRDLARHERVVERRLIDDWAARRIDQDRSGLHARQRPRIDQALGGRRQRDVEAHEIGLRQQVVQVDAHRAQLARGFRLGRIRVQHPHLEAAGTAGYRLADAPHTHDAQRRAVHVLAHKQCRPPGLPPTRAGEALRLADAPGGGHQQREGEIGGSVGEHAGRVADRDAAAGGSGEVDVVVADGHLADHAQARRGVDHVRVDRVGQ